ncbi:hypothetical protein CC78DRAFT_591808 [Lojkania enalia]|uniref:3-beta hydroxysteroid dehydrogenase/isomerase domain-containing protein n=1 Tax=Lojkania enalia TaxID=147567 RepID=A0A9P4K2I2_9PLEO|nr:hypothetical protein CC78DRAFT_591808 [Didymosphaeria enalia]
MLDISDTQKLMRLLNQVQVIFDKVGPQIVIHTTTPIPPPRWSAPTSKLPSSVCTREHKTQVSQNKKIFEFVYIQKAAEAHILAARAFLDPASALGVTGKAFFISDGKPEPFSDFVRRCYSDTGNPVSPQDVAIIPLTVIQAMASTGEWVFKIFTFSSKAPTLRRDSINHLDKGCC